MEKESRMAARIRRAAELKKNPGTSRNIDANGPELTEEDERILDEIDARTRRRIIENPEKYGWAGKPGLERIRQAVEKENTIQDTQDKEDVNNKGN